MGALGHVRPTLETTVDHGYTHDDDTIDTRTVLLVGPGGEGDTAWSLFRDGEWCSSGGSRGKAKGERTTRTTDWTPAVRRAMRDLGLDGLRFSDATVEPHGWSQGLGHAPQGVRVVWAGGAS